MSKSKTVLISLFFLTYSCSSVQEAVFPSLSDEEVVAPPALEEIPAAIEDATVAQNNQEIPPSQYAPPVSSASGIRHWTHRNVCWGQDNSVQRRFIEYTKCCVISQ